MHQGYICGTNSSKKRAKSVQRMTALSVSKDALWICSALDAFMLTCAHHPGLAFLRRSPSLGLGPSSEAPRRS